MTLLEIAIGTVVRIPSGWDSFMYRGLRYGRDQSGRWIVTAKVADENKSVSTAKRA